MLTLSRVNFLSTNQKILGPQKAFQTLWLLREADTCVLHYSEYEESRYYVRDSFQKWHKINNSLGFINKLYYLGTEEEKQAR